MAYGPMSWTIGLELIRPKTQRFELGFKFPFKNKILSSSCFFLSFKTQRFELFLGQTHTHTDTRSLNCFELFLGFHAHPYRHLLTQFLSLSLSLSPYLWSSLQLGMDGEELTEQETALYDRQIRVWGADAQRRSNSIYIYMRGFLCSSFVLLFIDIIFSPNPI